MSALGSPALGQRAEVDGVVADGVEGLAHDLLGRGVVTRDGQRAAVGRPDRAREGRQVREEDVVEPLDDLRVGREGLQQLGRGRRLVLELGHHAVALRVVVHRVDDDLAGERSVGQVATGSKGHGHDDDVAGPGRLVGRGGPRAGTELGDEVGQRLRPATVAQHHVVAGVDRQSRDGAADVSAADEAPGGHAGANAVVSRRHSPGVRHPAATFDGDGCAARPQWAAVEVSRSCGVRSLLTRVTTTTTRAPTTRPMTAEARVLTIQPSAPPPTASSAWCTQS